MSRIHFLVFFLLPAFLSQAQQTKKIVSPGIARPKLVVGIVVDQMRWDYLYRYYDRYASNGAFKRILQRGFSCENTLIPYTPTVTACGHTSLYTGTVPAIHGITGNGWYDNVLERSVYCTEDSSVRTVGTEGTVGQMSPRNLLTTTICDELRLATNFRSKVIGIAIKDRGGILPAGHSANAAYWYDSRSGNWISSTYYMPSLPQWVQNFNQRKWPDSFYARGWKTLYPIETYVQSTADEKPYESNPFGAEQTKFPYDLRSFIGKNYGAVSATPYGNTLTLEMSKAALTAEALGVDEHTDFLAISLSSPDYIGHAFGPNSIEAEDGFLRLDRELGAFLDFLDARVGKGQYLFFLSADHGVAHIPGFLQEQRIPASLIDDSNWQKELNTALEKKYKRSNLIKIFSNYQIHFDHKLIDSLDLELEAISARVVRELGTRKGLSRVVPLNELGEVPLPERLKEFISNGYFPKRSGDLQIVLDPHWIDGGAKGTTHGAWNPYDSHIPLLWYGWNIKAGKTNREIYMTDAAATIAALLRIQAPSGSIGKVIPELVP